MHALMQLFRTRPSSWQGCRPLSAAERMARYSPRHAADMQQRENAGAAAPRVRVVEGRMVIVDLLGHINKLPAKDPA